MELYKTANRKAKKGIICPSRLKTFFIWGLQKKFQLRKTICTQDYKNLDVKKSL